MVCALVLFSAEGRGIRDADSAESGSFDKAASRQTGGIFQEFRGVARAGPISLGAAAQNAKPPGEKKAPRARAYCPREAGRRIA